MWEETTRASVPVWRPEEIKHSDTYHDCAECCYDEVVWVDNPVDFGLLLLSDRRFGKMNDGALENPSEIRLTKTDTAKRFNKRNRFSIDNSLTPESSKLDGVFNALFGEPIAARSAFPGSSYVPGTGYIANAASTAGMAFSCSTD